MTISCAAMALMSGRAITIAVLMLLTSTRADAAMCLDVDLRFEERAPPSALIETMKHETEEIWKSYEVRIEWITGGSGARCAWSLGSLDVLVSDRNRGAAPTWSRATLGSTRVRRGTIDHAPVHIARGATEHLLESLAEDELFRTLGHPVASAADVGRALGRVLAHEIGHLILAAPDHQLHGLMRATFFALDLIRAERSPYTLSAAEVARLRCREVVLEGEATENRADDDRPRVTVSRDVCSARTNSEE
jgi:hypothetical protein